MNKPISISKLTTLASDLQAIFPLNEEGELNHFLANKLYGSLEAFEWAIEDKDINRLSIYWLAYDSYHFAEILAHHSDTEHKKLKKIRKQLTRLKDLHSEGFTEVSP